MKAKKDPRGIAPRVLKQTDDSLKILSYGGEGVKQARQPIQALGGRLKSVQELLSEQLDCLLEIPPGHFHRCRNSDLSCQDVTELNLLNLNLV